MKSNLGTDLLSSLTVSRQGLARDHEWLCLLRLPATLSIRWGLNHATSLHANPGFAMVCVDSRQSSFSFLLSPHGGGWHGRSGHLVTAIAKLVL